MTYVFCVMSYTQNLTKYISRAYFQRSNNFGVALYRIPKKKTTVFIERGLLHIPLHRFDRFKDLTFFFGLAVVTSLEILLFRMK